MNKLFQLTKKIVFFSVVLVLGMHAPFVQASNESVFFQLTVQNHTNKALRVIDKIIPADAEWFRVDNKNHPTKPGVNEMIYTYDIFDSRNGKLVCKLITKYQYNEKGIIPESLSYNSSSNFCVGTVNIGWEEHIYLAVRVYGWDIRN